MTHAPFAHALPNLSPRHVPRPRLTRLLDDARSQALVLDAPAGYGKTSLAAEWLRERDDVGWFTAQPQSGDVGAAVLGVALAASRVVPRAADRVQQRLSIVEEPTQTARTFAEILAEDIGDWPSGGIVAIDDYHHLAESDAAESFIDWLLVLRPSLRVLVATRRRPSWASARRVLAGEIFELDKRLLSMTNDEIATVLGENSQHELHSLIEKAEGWPAVIGLAAMAPMSDFDAAPRIADDLFRYFAEELLRSMSEDERRTMLIASVPRSVTYELLRTLAGEDSAARMRELLDRGLLAETPDGTLRFHPLVREFLLKQLRRNEEETLRAIAQRLLEQARERADWDDAFDASLMLEDLGLSADVAGDAADALIRTRRVETLERWLAACGDASDTSTSATVAQAKLLHLAGRFGAARALALDAERMSPDGDLDRGEALVVAGRASHSLGYSQEALDLFLRANQSSCSATVRTEALSGAALAAADLEDEQAVEFARQLESEPTPSREQRLRAFTRWVIVDDRMGSLANARARMLAIDGVGSTDVDPLVYSAALSSMTHILCAGAEFDRALEVAEQGRTYCERFRLPWAANWFQLVSTRALLGLGEIAAARSVLARLQATADETEDIGYRVVYERACVQLSLHQDAAQLARRPETVGEHAGRVPRALVGELRAFQALGAAVRGSLDNARSKAHEARSTSSAVECTCYSQLVLALVEDVAASRAHPSVALQRAAMDAADRCLHEAVVVVARQHRPLLSWSATQPALSQALRRARLITERPSAGLRSGDAQPWGLTPRELEVLGLVAKGCTNADIANRLVISLGTAKTHVHRVLRKLGARNRSEATFAYLTHTGGSPSQAAETSSSPSSG